jgi:hypothetical protein
MAARCDKLFPPAFQNLGRAHSPGGAPLAWFRAQVHRAGGGSYQTLMNATLRRVLKDDLRRFKAK